MDTMQQAQGTERDSGQHRRHTPKERKNRKIIRAVVYLVLIGLSAAAWWQITLRGYELAKSYIDQSVQAVRQENQVSVMELQERIDTLGEEMAQLRSSLDNAGSSISNSATVQERIDDRLSNLDKQLQDLEKSLKVLKEAP